MTREERRALLSDAELADAHAQADAAPPPPPELIALLRPILTRPALRRTAEADVSERREAA